MISVAIKATRVGYLIACYVVLSRWAERHYDEEHDRRIFLIRNTQRHARKLLRVLGVSVTLSGINRRSGQYLIVANHLSYVDVLVLAATMPSVFVTSVEVSQDKFLGVMARCAGSLFVERRNKAWLLNEVSEISKMLKDGFNVVIFPEGTSTSGAEVLPFKMSLLDAAIQSQVDVLPVCLNYNEINGDKPDTKSRDSVFYYGEMDFFSHLKRLLSLRTISVGVEVLEPLTVTANSCRKELARVAYQKISQSFIPIF